MKQYKPPYTITNKIINLCITISRKVGKLDYVNDLSRYPLLQKSNRKKSISSTLNIENVFVSYDDVSNILQNNKDNDKYSLEVKNTFNAYKHIDGYDAYSQEDLLKAHKLMMEGLVDDAGKYRMCSEGVVDQNGNVIHLAPNWNLVPKLMNDLFAYLKNSDENILIKSCVFHYEFEFIHPFRDGNGRIGRLWQTTILASDNPLFKWLPIESIIYKYQKEYYQTIEKCDLSGNSTLFIEFMLRIINEALDDMLNDASNESFYSKEIEKLLKVITPYPQTTNQLMKKVNIKSRCSFYLNYLKPAIEKALIKMTEPDKPKSKNQRYYK